MTIVFAIDCVRKGKDLEFKFGDKGANSRMDSKPYARRNLLETINENMEDG